MLFGNRSVGGNFVPSLLIAFLDAFATGVLEESMLRGLVFNALLSKEGGSYKGIFTAIIISSLFFGFLHVAPDFFSSFPHISLDAASQMIGKTLESGMVGFLLAAIYLRNHNIWNIALIHALNDFFLMVPVYMLNTGTGNYVQSSGALSGGLVYYIEIILSIPYIITAIRIVKHTPLPQYGFYEEEWEPVAIESKF